jgi:hypothetical protein
LRERKGEVQKFESRMVALGSSELEFFKKTNEKRERDEKLET